MPCASPPKRERGKQAAMSTRRQPEQRSPSGATPEAQRPRLNEQPASCLPMPLVLPEAAVDHPVDHPGELV